MSITTFPSVFGQLRSGGLRPIAVTGETRSSIFPDLPTIAEAGVPGYAAVIHYGMVAPAGIGRALAERLNAELRTALGTEDVRARIVDEGGEPLPGTRDQQAADMAAEEASGGAFAQARDTVGLRTVEHREMRSNWPTHRSELILAIARRQLYIFRIIPIPTDG
jgi:tripartite-type tricarboxylate transporter receptor subunit TctC